LLISFKKNKVSFYYSAVSTTNVKWR
jgi:hypothetical protein